MKSTNSFFKDLDKTIIFIGIICGLMLILYPLVATEFITKVSMSSFHKNYMNFIAGLFYSPETISFKLIPVFTIIAMSRKYYSDNRSVSLAVLIITISSMLTNAFFIIPNYFLSTGFFIGIFISFGFVKFISWKNPYKYYYLFAFLVIIIPLLSLILPIVIGALKHLIAGEVFADGPDSSSATDTENNGSANNPAGDSSVNSSGQSANTNTYDALSIQGLNPVAQAIGVGVAHGVDGAIQIVPYIPHVVVGTGFFTGANIAYRITHGIPLPQRIGVILGGGAAGAVIVGVTTAQVSLNSEPVEVTGQRTALIEQRASSPSNFQEYPH